VLPSLKSIYPGVEQRLLDSPPVVRDVIFERSRNQAVNPYAAGAPSYRTVLVSGFGPSLGGYYALDVTNPVRSNDPQSGPRLLWQVTTAAPDGSPQLAQPLFGTSIAPVCPGATRPPSAARATAPPLRPPRSTRPGPRARRSTATSRPTPRARSRSCASTPASW